MLSGVSVRVLGSSDTIGDGREAPVVLVAAAGSPGALSATLHQLLAWTDEHVALVLACADADLAAVETPEADREILLLELGSERGPAAALRALRARAPQCDLVLVGEGVLVGPGWLDGLREAAHADSIVMTASPLSQPGLDGHGVEAAAAAVHEASLRLRPTISRARSGCCYLRAAALELVGLPGSDAADADPVADVSARLSALGLVHVLADEVCVGMADDGVLAGDAGPLKRAVAAAVAPLRPLSVTVDARALGTAATGTRTYILDLIVALARADSLRLRVLLPPDTSPEVHAVLEADDAIELITYAEAVAGVALTDVVHRPQQIFTTDDLTLLRLVGERIVITHHDLIAYRCGAYHDSAEEWQDFRRVTRLALGSADVVVFSSRHARDDALREDLIAPQRARVVPLGAERVWPQPPAAELRPAGVPEQGALLVCIGADYAHKNRPFALALARALRDRHGWDGHLVLAGPHVELGSSRPAEQAMLEADGTLASLVLDIGPVDDAERAWLYRHAQAVVYPTVYEGFGLVPFEAAQAGVPCLYAAAGALAELAGSDLATLVAWDPDASADAVASLLVPGEARDRHLQALRDAAAAMSWAECVPMLRAVYDDAVRSPYRASAPRVAEELEREAHIVALAASAEHDRERARELAHANEEAQRANDEAQHANEEAQRANDEAQQALRALRSSVGAFLETSAGGLLTPAQRRGLLRVVSRPALRRVLLAPFAAAGRSAQEPERDEQ